MSHGTRLNAVTVGLALFLALAGSVAAQDQSDLREGFLADGLNAAKVFDVNGEFTVRGPIGIGTENPARLFHAQGQNAVFRMDRDSNSVSFILVRTAPNDFNTITQAWTFGGRDDSFVINDLGNQTTGGGTRRLTVDLDGNFGINTTAPAAALQVNSTPAAFLLGLVDGGNARFVVQKDGLVVVEDEGLIYRGTTTPAGGIQQGSIIGDGDTTFFADTNNENAWLGLNEDNATIASPADGPLGILSLFDEDALNGSATALPELTFDNDAIRFVGGGDKLITADDLGNNEEIRITTTGEEIQFVSDSDNNTIQGPAFSWFANGTAAANTHMELEALSGDLSIDGTLTENAAFDLAEAFWKSHDGIDVGHVVRADADGTAVKLAASAADPAVIGVVSTKPGILMGGGAFSLVGLRKVWGDEVAAAFEGERDQLFDKVLEEREDLQRQSVLLHSFDAFLEGRLGADYGKAFDKPEDQAELLAAYEDKLQRLAVDVEKAELDVFFRRHFVNVALAGRVPVKVDAGYGAIRVGDLLVSSPTPGHAMRAAEARTGTVIGKALRPLDEGQGTVLMLVMLR